MEVSVAGKDVLVTTHKTYRAVDEGNALQSLKEYTPMQKFLSGCEERGPVPRAIIVRNILRIAHRIVGVMADVEYVDSTGLKVTQPLQLIDAQPAVLLPVAQDAEGKRYAILVKQRRLAYGMAVTQEAFLGVVENEVVNVGGAQEALLSHVGVNVSSAQPINASLYTIGNEGSIAYRMFTVPAELADGQLQELLQATAVSDPQAMPSLVAMPLEAVLSTSDAKASLAVSLLL